MRPTRSPFYPLQPFVPIRAIRGLKYFVEDECLEGTTERSDSNRGRSPREEAIALILPGRQYATGHAPSLHWCRLVRPTRSPFYHWEPFVSICAIRGQKLIRCLLRSQKTTSSCLKLSLLSSYTPSLHWCRLVRPTRSPFLLAHSLRVNSCNSWAKIYTHFLSTKNPSTQHLFT